MDVSVVFCVCDVNTDGCIVNMKKRSEVLLEFRKRIDTLVAT
jgi:hypothetical protein